MKSTTKKTIIIIAAVALIATIVYLVLRKSKYTIEGIVSKLDFSNYSWSSDYNKEHAKPYLIAEAKAAKAEFSRAEINKWCEEDGLTFNKELVYLGASKLKAQGFFNAASVEDILTQLKSM